jgi:hypothetical protein
MNRARVYSVGIAPRTEAGANESVMTLTGHRVSETILTLSNIPVQALLPSWHPVTCPYAVDFLLTGGGLGLRQVGLERTGTALERLVQRKCNRVLTSTRLYQLQSGTVFISP